MPKFNTIDDLEVRGKRVLVRADLNTPMKDGAVTDKTRIERSLPTILELTNARAQVIVMSHFGRPKGEVVPEMSLKPVAEALGHAVGHGIAFAPDCIGEEAERVAAAVSDGDIVVAQVEGYEATLKRFRRKGNTIVLEAANPAYEPRVLPIGSVKVQGRLVGLIRTY